MDLCKDVPAVVRQKLGSQGDAFQKLRKASFAECLGEQIALRLSPCCRNVGRNDCAFLLRGASERVPRAQLQDVRSFPGIEPRTSEAGLDPPRMQVAPSDARKLQELDMSECNRVPAAAWQRLARWEQLRKAKFEKRLGRRLLRRS